MSAEAFITCMLSWYPILPGAVLCFAPMKNRLRSEGRSAHVRILVTVLILMALMAFVEVFFSTGHVLLLPLVFPATFGAYHMSLKVPLCKSLAVYLLAVDFTAFLVNFSNGYDAAINPDSTLANFSFEASLFQAVITTAFAAIVYRPLKRFGSMLVDQFDLQRVWFSTLPISGLLLIYNLMIAPRKYETVHINYAFVFYWASLFILMTLLLLLCVIFYFIVSGMMEAAEERERNRILEMQESAYLTQQRYIEETARARHDFKHTIGILDMLVSQGNLTAVREYLDEYLAAQPQKENVDFCSNTAVNALLNYYNQMAKADDIPLNLEISLQDDPQVSDIDLCSILGNILENAILACRDLPPEKRFIDLAVRREKDAPIYIVATNSFDGKVRMGSDGEYVSTRRSGSGLGLRSIRQTAARYGGSVRFRNTCESEGDAEFCTDVVLPSLLRQ